MTKRKKREESMNYVIVKMRERRLRETTLEGAIEKRGINNNLIKSTKTILYFGCANNNFVDSGKTFYLKLKNQKTRTKVVHKNVS